MRFKYVILSILLLRGMDLIAQDTGIYPIYDFAIRNSAMECFLKLRTGDSGVYSLLLSEQAAEEGSDFPAVVCSMSKLARVEVPSAGVTLSQLKPYVGYDYRYISHNDISYVIGIAYAEYLSPDPGVVYNMTARILYFVYTDKGWKVFWVGSDWKQARFADKDKLVILDSNSQEIPLSVMTGKLRDEFYAQLDGTPSNTEPEQQTENQQLDHFHGESESATSSGVDSDDEVNNQEPVPYDSATVKPTFGGRDASCFSDWVRRHIRYPESARKQDLSGTTKLKFLIDTLGRVTYVRVVESAGKRTKEEFEEQVKLASYICNQYKDKMDDLVKKNFPISKIMEMQKRYDEALQYYNRLRRLATNRNYVLPEYVILDDEAKRAVQSSPRWEPGEFRHRLVPVEYSISVNMKP